MIALAACAPQPATDSSSVRDATPPPSATAGTASAVGAAQARAAPEPASARVDKKAVHASRHIVAAAHPLAADAGLEILRAGGSAVDAAIAAQMVLNLVEPQSSGLGGGGFLMHYAAQSGEIAAYDGRETAPQSAHPYMFLDGDGAPRAFFDAAVGGLSVGVPGLLRMLDLAHREHGKLPWARLFAPAIRLADDGFAISPRLHRLLAVDAHLKTTSPAAARLYYRADGSAKPAGAVLKNPELARTLRTLARRGADAFYEGPLAKAVVAAVREAPRNPGLMSATDLAQYRAVKRDPLCLPYRVWLVCGAPPPTSGGVATLQILGLLQGFDLAALAPGTVEAVHLIAEASRLAFADRSTYVADPDFIPVPTAGMLDPGYLEGRARLISRTRSLEEAQPGMPGISAGLRFAPGTLEQGTSTTHLSVIDADGNAVALTSSIENVFGSRLMVEGFLLNNQLTDFSFVPNQGGAPVANRVAPGKRPRSSMAPTLVFDAGGRMVLAIGSPGGTAIIGYVAKTLIAALDWKLDVQGAIDLPHFVNRGDAIELEAETALVDLAPRLRALGHDVKIDDMPSGLHGVARAGGGLVGGADPRREGVARGD